MNDPQVRMKVKFDYENGKVRIEDERAKVIGLKIHEDDRTIWEEWCAKEPGFRTDLPIEYVGDEEFEKVDNEGP